MQCNYGYFHYAHVWLILFKSMTYWLKYKILFCVLVIFQMHFLLFIWFTDANDIIHLFFYLLIYVFVFLLLSLKFERSTQLIFLNTDLNQGPFNINCYTFSWMWLPLFSHNSFPQTSSLNYFFSLRKPYPQGNLSHFYFNIWWQDEKQYAR